VGSLRLLRLAVSAALALAIATGSGSGSTAEERPARTSLQKASRDKKKAARVEADLSVLSRFSTKFKPGEARVKNIKRIAELINGTVVPAGESFSLNRTVGARTEERGFVPAPSILDLEYVETVGGGVSQFATTLYNALYNAGFPILEHKPHSHYISRYPPGVEATLSWPGPDLVFKNDSESPVVIKATVSKDRVSVKLLGHTPGRKVDRKAPVELERKSAPVELVGDATISPSKQKIERPGSPRRTVRVERTIQNPGKPKKVDQEVVVYLSSKKVVRVHPCKLPIGHKDRSQEPCPTKGKRKSAKKA
jgi:vancomycin resistance protein YoaR